MKNVSQKRGSEWLLHYTMFRLSLFLMQHTKNAVIFSPTLLTALNPMQYFNNVFAGCELGQL